MMDRGCPIRPIAEAIEQLNHLQMVKTVIEEVCGPGLEATRRHRGSGVGCAPARAMLRKELLLGRTCKKRLLCCWFLQVWRFRKLLCVEVVGNGNPSMKIPKAITLTHTLNHFILSALELEFFSPVALLKS